MPKRDCGSGSLRKRVGETDPIRALVRLKRDVPALADRVVRGELSANAAAIQAGFRKRKIQAPVDDIESAANHRHGRVKRVKPATSWAPIHPYSPPGCLIHWTTRNRNS